MWDKGRQLLHHFLNLLLAGILLLGCLSYVAINSILLTAVLNELRLDSYITIQTGFGIVSLILLLGWMPWYLIRRFGDRA